MGGKRESEDTNPVTDSELDVEKSRDEDGITKTTSPVAKKAKVETPERVENIGKAPTEKQDSQQSPEPAPEAQVRHETLSENALVIFGLHPLITKEEMNEVMAKYGKVERLETRKAFASTYCFCDYETAAEASEAIKELNGTSLKGKELIVKLANDNKAKSKPFTG